MHTKWTGVTGRCKNCGCQIHWDGKVWTDNSGGDVCGYDGENSPHVDSLDNYGLNSLSLPQDHLQ